MQLLVERKQVEYFGTLVKFDYTINEDITTTLVINQYYRMSAVDVKQGQTVISTETIFVLVRSIFHLER